MLAVMLAAGAVAASNTSAASTGFWANAKLAPAAASVAGKKVSVNCFTTRAAFVAFVAASDNPVADVQGFVPVTGGTVMYLSPETCAYLDAWLNGKKVANLYGVAGSMLTLAHEAEHLKGLADETDTDCAALRALPRMVTKFFPLKGRESMHDLMFDAWRGHSSKAPQYQTHAC